jgi:DNA-binding transcriptional ArsR family regulator
LLEALDPVFNRVAAYFGLLSEPMRLRIVQAVSQVEKTVSDIVAATGATQTNISRHLNRMHAAGALARRKNGNRADYRVAATAPVEICRNVCVRIAAGIDDQQPLREILLQLIPPAPRARRKGARHG